VVEQQLSLAPPSFGMQRLVQLFLLLLFSRVEQQLF